MAKAKKSPKTGKNTKKPGKRGARIAQDAMAKAPIGEGIKDSGSKKPGRPSVYSAELAARICAEIAGGKSLRAVCDLDWAPHRDTVFAWLADEGKKEFSDQYARACEERGVYLAEDALTVSDEAVPFVETQYGKHYDAGAVANKRLRVDTRKWFASKLAPRVFGEVVTQKLTGADGGPVQLQQLPPPDYSKIRAMAEKHAARNANRSR